MDLFRRVHTRHRLEVLRLLAKSVFRDRPGERGQKLLFQFRQFDAVLRSLRTSDARHDAAQIQFEFGRIAGIASLRNAKQPLGAIIIFVEPAMFCTAPGRAEVIQALEIDGEETHRSEEHTSELQSLAYLVCRLLLEK